jgi:hypothetical protein
LIVPRLIKSRGAGTTSFADTLAPKNWLPLPRDLILALTRSWNFTSEHQLWSLMTTADATKSLPPSDRRGEMVLELQV